MNGDRLLDQQPRSHSHALRHEVFVEAVFTKLRIGALQLTRGSGQCARRRRKRKLAPVMMDNQDPRKQIQAASLAKRIDTHTP
jgi:hypothetical protein